MGEGQISDAEWQVMRIIWNRKTATAAEVIAGLSETSGWTHRTIRTLLARLVEKGALATESDGHRYLYRPLLSRGKCIRRECQTFVNKVFGGDAAELLAHFARSAAMSPAQVEELKRMLDDKHP
ncbi:BlaI/MecI/CopY family transcriptional regulator [soil metagenome]